MDDKLFDSIKGLVNDTWKYRFATIICCIGILVLFCMIIINFFSLKDHIGQIEKHIAVLENDNKDLNFEIGKTQGLAMEKR